MGYIPEGMRNYLARLGWGHGDDEVFSDEQAISWFDVKDVVKAPARLDWAKLNFINGQHLRQADDGRLADLTLKALQAQKAELPADAAARLLAVVPQVKEGAKTILELAEHCAFALKVRPLALEEKTVKQLTDETVERLTSPARQLARGAGLGRVGAGNPVEILRGIRGRGLWQVRSLVARDPHRRLPGAGPEQDHDRPRSRRVSGAP
jgi:glutamyl-tRNA synthetase